MDPIEQIADICQTRTQTALGLIQQGKHAEAEAELWLLCEDLTAHLAPAPEKPPEPAKHDGDGRAQR